nr:probable serine/threonine-protein kinase PBL1 [Arachis hypogaea]
MGFLAFLKSKKKKIDEMMLRNRINRIERVARQLIEHGTQESSPAASFSVSAPSPGSEAEEDGSASVTHEQQQQQQPKREQGSMKDHFPTNPQPVPLPCPPPQHASGSSLLSHSASLRYFLYDEIAAACDNFSSDRCVSDTHCVLSSSYKASFGDDSSRKLQATVNRLHPSTQGLKEFINEVNTLASLQHPNICRLLGFHARDSSEPRMLVYERLHLGSLDRLLFYGTSDYPTLDWNSRLKIAICAAQDLTFLHDEGPFQATYNEFSTANIQVEKDFSAKLSGYGCVVGRVSEEAIRNMSMETFERGILTPKSNVWSFGIILLELLTGIRNVDSRHPNVDKNIVKWSWPFLNDEFRLSMIMDPKLKGHYPLKAARMLADIAHRCLQKEPSIRPTMRTVVKHLKMIQEMKFSPQELVTIPLGKSVPLPPPPEARTRLSAFPLSQPTRKPIPSFNLSSPSDAPKQHVSPPKWSDAPATLSPHPWPSIQFMEKVVRQESRHGQSSS